MNGFRQRFQEQGLSWAILLWAAAIALMAYHLDDSPWRWAFASLALGGVVTVWGMGRIRRYVDTVNKTTQPETRS